MRKVVVNSTPLIVLCGIGRLDILGKYGIGTGRRGK